MSRSARPQAHKPETSWARSRVRRSWTIGAVEIEERYSLVDVREDRANDVLQALQGKTIRGRPVTVSRYQTDKAERKRKRAHVG